MRIQMGDLDGAFNSKTLDRRDVRLWNLDHDHHGTKGKVKMEGGRSSSIQLKMQNDNSILIAADHAEKQVVLVRVVAVCFPSWDVFQEIAKTVCSVCSDNSPQTPTRNHYTPAYPYIIDGDRAPIKPRHVP